MFLVGQHMAQHAVTGVPAAPMPNRISAWAIYDIFETADDEMVFVGVVSDAQWQSFCAAFDLAESRQRLSRSHLTAIACRARERIMPVVRERFARHETG